ncbi:MAG: sulfatase-like hydrolase/transferase [Phycisphaerales bacterium]|nr:sulfatase-like hydrolase/transferase [Phycisphaerales bacterium]
MQSGLDRRHFLQLSGAGALSTALSGCIAAARTGSEARSRRPDGRSSKHPNFLILFTDDQRFDTIRALGNSEIHTPNMDRLVRRGVTFRNTYVMGAHHGAVCMPSRAMLLTGRHYFNLPRSVKKTWDVPAAEQGSCGFPTFPELLWKAGYDTFGTGKWHNSRQLFARGFTHGGNIFFGGMANHLKTPVYDFDPTGEYPEKEKRVGEKFSSELFSDAAIDFLERHSGDNPFLMYVSYTAPHDPRMAPAEFAAMYPPEKIKLPPNIMPEHPFPIGDLRVRDEKLAPFPRTPEVVREHIAAYYAMITHLDAQIGRVLEALQASGEADNTVIIFTSDNGLAVGQHGLLGKQNIYEHSSHVPLVMCGPGIPQGRRSDALCYLHDVCPTICDLAGLPIPASVQTHSLRPLLTDARAKVRDSIFLAYSTDAHRKVEGVLQPRGVLRGVRSGPWKLIRSEYDGHRETLLFNLREDPWEMRNLAHDHTQTDRVARMTRLLHEWSKRSGDAASGVGQTGTRRSGRQTHQSDRQERAATGEEQRGPSP